MQSATVCGGSGEMGELQEVEREDEKLFAKMYFKIV